MANTMSVLPFADKYTTLNEQQLADITGGRMANAAQNAGGGGGTAGSMGFNCWICPRGVR